MTRILDIPGLPGAFTADGAWDLTAGGLTIRTGARTDHFLPPGGGPGNLSSARLLTPAPDGDFVLSARVSVDFASGFDAGTLFVQIDDATWAKLCFEASPGLVPMVVSVVTRGVSDDANAFDVDGTGVHLRLARVGAAFAFHASTDGEKWEFVRYFALGNPGDELRIGFGAQSPTGEGCDVRFSGLSLESRTLADLRDGS